MYDELVQKLRSVKDAWQSEEGQWMLDAADAIETMCEMVATAHQEISNIITTYEEDKPHWISVKERLPEDKAWVLCKCRAGIYEVLKWTGDSWYHDTNHCYMKGFVTHWMPLPEPPKEGGGEDG